MTGSEDRDMIMRLMGELEGRVDTRLDGMAQVVMDNREREVKEHRDIRADVADSEERQAKKIDSVRERLEERVWKGTIGIMVTVAAAAVAQGFLPG